MDESFKISPENKKIVQISIVAVILSMAIGNMFVVRRLKNVAKLHPFDRSHKSKASEVPFEDEVSNPNSYYKTSSEQAKTSGSNTSHKSSGRTKSYKNNFDKQYHHPFPSSTSTPIIKLPTHVVHCLNTLGLPVTSSSMLPRINDVKDAYHKLALKNHPDLLPMDADESKKQEYQKKFQIISAAYQDVMKYFEYSKI